MNTNIQKNKEGAGYRVGAIFLFLSLIMIGCKKETNNFLNAKPSSNIEIPTTLDDFQALLDNDNGNMNRAPELDEISADDYYVAYFAYTSIYDQFERNAYIWDKDIFDGQGNITDYNVPYSQVLAANVVLSGLNNIAATASNQVYWNKVKGIALFMRAYAFYNVAQCFAPVYDPATSKTDLGIPLRMMPDINTKTTRSTVEQTYDQVLSDLKTSVNFVQPALDNFRNRPSKPSVYAMLARVYLSMRNYTQAFNYADSCLNIYDKLIDYNTVNYNLYSPFTPINDESMFDVSGVGDDITGFIGLEAGYSIDTTLYAEYAPNDLRQLVYFYPYGGYINMNAGYDGVSPGTRYQGLATDEVYLIRAECYARNGNTNAAMVDLNTLLSYRFQTGTFVPYTAKNSSDALSQILTERRKELVMRNLRWSDLRRLNKEGYNITLTRKLNGVTYTLPPNDPRYVLPFPPDVISLTGIQQNPR